MYITKSLRYLPLFLRRGPRALERDRRPTSALSPPAAILLHAPGRLNLEHACWTRKAIAGFAEQSFGVRLPEWIVTAYLRDWGFSSQKEVRRAFERAPAQPRAPAAACVA